MNGKLSKDQFVGKLHEFDIQVDERVNTLIRNTESGSIPRFYEFGKVILRRLSGLNAYNRVDKVNLNNDRIVNPSKTGRTFGFIQPLLTPESSDLIITEQ